MKIPRLTNYLAPVLLLGLLFFSCQKKVEEKPQEPKETISDPIRVVAMVNGDPITLGEFQAWFDRSGLKPEQETALEIKVEFLNRLIERKMMLREAQRKRITIGLPEINKRISTLQKEYGKGIKEMLADQGIDFEKWKSDLWADMMIERLLASEVNQPVSVASSEIRNYYQENPREFERPELVRCRQIVVDTEAEAKAVLELLRAGGDFAALAKEKSTAPEAGNGGDLGSFAMGEMPAEFNVVFGLPEGGVSGIVKSPYGFHLFKLEEKLSAGKIDLKKVSPDIAAKLRREKEEAQYKKWLMGLRSRTKLEVNYKALEY